MRGFGGTNPKHMNFIFTSREEWLSQRKKGVGGSDIAAICGHDPYRTPLDVYLDKIGEAEPIQDNDFMKAGRYLEPVVADMFQDETGLQLISMPSTIVGAKPHYLASVDRSILGQNIPVEIKTSKRYHAEPLDKWKLQATWYAGIMNAEGYYIAWFTYPTFKYQYFEFDAVMFEEMCRMADEFWECVETRTPPENNKFTASIGSAIEASEYLAGRLNILRAKKHAHDELGEEIEALTEEVKLVMRENEILTINGAIAATWKQSKPRETVDTKKLKAEHPDVFELVKKTGEPVRTFKLK